MIKKIALIFVLLSNIYASLVLEPEYSSDINVLRSLDISDSFLKDKIFLKIKRELTKEKRDKFITILDRGEIFVPTLRKMILDNDIPQVFLYMAMAESHFKTNAYSRARASGLWQFIPSTARLYGLKIDEYIDERRDPVKSTEAAIKYLKKLHKIFGKWYLAALAYNSGEGRVLRAIKRAKSDELQVLLDEKRKFLPKESRNYIRKIVSLAFMANNPNFFAYRDMFNRSESNSLVRVKVGGGETLEYIASKIGIELKLLKELNPQFKHNFTPPIKGAYINIPYNKLANYKQFYKPSKKSKMYLIYVVKKGDTIGAIAKRYGITYKMIQKFNNLKNTVIYPKQTLILPIPRREVVYYTVKKGDSIYKIARLFNVKIESIKLRNGLKNNLIHVGDRLVIPK